MARTVLRRSSRLLTQAKVVREKTLGEPSNSTRVGKGKYIIRSAAGKRRYKSSHGVAMGKMSTRGTVKNMTARTSGSDGRFSMPPVMGGRTR